jgi:sodium transport system ATP-binding protein
MPSSPVVELEEVTKRFGRRGAVVALDTVTLAIPGGGVTLLLGANGAGKSTLLRVIAGTIAPTSGRVRSSGAIGILLGNSFGLYDRLSAREYLRYIGALRGLSGSVLEARIDTVIRELEIVAFAHRRCGEFSAGMKQRTALAASILHEPEILLLDEPTTGLDLSARGHVMETIRRLAESGRGMIVSTHHPEEVRSLANRVVVLNGGKVIIDTAAGDPVFEVPGGIAAAALAAIREANGSVSSGEQR